MALLGNGLLPASFRGVPFAVIGNETAGGRRLAVHQYPGRDVPWAEDMGREARRYRFRGFICDNDVVFSGGPIQLQRALLLAALEAKGEGTLISPTQGIRKVSVARFSIGEDLGAGTMSTLEIEFVEAGSALLGRIGRAVSGLLAANGAAIAAMAANGVRAIALARARGGRREELTIAATDWSTAIVAAGEDATALHRLAARLPGNNGRYAGGGAAGFAGQLTASGATLAQLTEQAASARAAIATAAYALADATEAASLEYATGVPAAVAALIAAFAAACADPADALRLLAQLAVRVPLRPEARMEMGSAIDAMMRRAIGAAIALAAGSYQPKSADDAATVLRIVAQLLDGMALAASNAGDDDSYTALRALRGAVVTDLRARSATLQQLKDIRTERPLPALVLAQRLYRDAGRADQLIAQADPASPLFLPIRFAALAA